MFVFNCPYIYIVCVLRSHVVSSKQPKLGLTQEFVVRLVRMRWVACLCVLFVKTTCVTPCGASVSAMNMFVAYLYSF